MPRKAQAKVTGIQLETSDEWPYISFTHKRKKYYLFVADTRWCVMADDSRSPAERIIQTHDEPHDLALIDEVKLFALLQQALTELGWV